MKMIFTILMFSFFRMAVHSQQTITEQENDIHSNQLEESAEDEEEESENDYDLQQLKFLSKHPLDINGSDLEKLPLIDPLLINNLAGYRKLLGDIIDLHELQAVPGFDVELIRSILPYVTIVKDKFSLPAIRERFTKGELSVLVRPSIIPERSLGFSHTSDHQFTGSRPALLIRYQYKYKDLLQFGFVADKDAGEKLLDKRMMPDFVSFHIFASKIGMIRSVAFGDYTINLGQGLIHWQSQAFRKSSSVLSIKRQGEVLRPYHSAGEFNFLRGVAVSISKRSFELSVFLSRKNLTANIDGNAITSIITSGLHRTIEELKDKNAASLFTSGSALKLKLNRGHIGLNGIYHLYSLPLKKRDEWYNLFTIKGRDWINISTDYSYTLRNFHFFGEVAADQKWSLACVNGVMSSLSPSVDAAVLFRRLSKSYQTVFGNAFTENTMPANERGMYMGVSLKPHLKWKVDLYGDLFSFPWLKYRLDAPSGGFAYLIQLTWKPNRQTEIYSRYRYRLKPLNIENEEEDLRAPGLQAIQHWRTHISQQVSRTIMIRTRVEICIFSDQFLSAPVNGYLFYTDIGYKPVRSRLSGNIRIQSFEIKNYDARIYAYENDLLFVSSTPSYYNNGIRCYINVRAKTKLNILINSMLTFSLKLSTTVYNNISTIGTGPASIDGNRISTVKLQIFIGS